MEYTVKKLAELAGVSARTLRYYDQIDLLRPKRISSSGYRIYGTEEVDKLQHILFFRALDLSLEQIKQIINTPTYHSLTLLQNHKTELLLRRQKLDLLIQQVDQTIASQKGASDMADQDKFIAFKEQSIQENNQKYGDEIRQKYGEESLNNANSSFLNMDEEAFESHRAVEENLLHLLAENPTLVIPSITAETIFKNHQQWLTAAWGSYSLDAHLGIAELYLADDRFATYYTKKAGSWAAANLVAVIHYYGKTVN